MLSKHKKEEVPVTECRWCDEGTIDETKLCTNCIETTKQKCLEVVVAKAKQDVCKNPEHRRKGIVLNAEGTESRTICWDCRRSREGGCKSRECERQAIKNSFALKTLDHLKSIGPKALGLPEETDKVYFGKFGYYLNGTYYTDMSPVKVTDKEAEPLCSREFQYLSPIEFALAHERFGEDSVLDLAALDNLEEEDEKKMRDALARMRMEDHNNNE